MDQRSDFNLNNSSVGEEHLDFHTSPTNTELSLTVSSAIVFIEAVLSVLLCEQKSL